MVAEDSSVRPVEAQLLRLLVLHECQATREESHVLYAQKIK
jgi:hypothetical protein